MLGDTRKLPFPVQAIPRVIYIFLFFGIWGAPFPVLSFGEAEKLQSVENIFHRIQRVYRNKNEKHWVVTFVITFRQICEMTKKIK